MEKNIKSLVPQRGDIAYTDKNGDIQYIAFDTFDRATFGAENTIFGVVYGTHGNKVMVLDKNQSTKKWSDAFRWETSGWQLDGSEHPTIISFYESQAAPANPTFKYNATSLEQVAAQLNQWLAAYFAQTQIQYNAYVEDETLKIVCETYDQWYRYVMTISTISLTYAVAKELEANTDTFALNGQGSIYKGINWQQFREKVGDNTGDIGSTFFPANPERLITSVPSTPISHKAYFSANIPNITEFLYGLYEEDAQTPTEEGYNDYLKDYMIEFPAQRGIFGNGMRSGYDNTYTLADKTYRSHDGSDKLMYPAIQYAADIEYGNPAIAKGKWYLPSMYEMMEIFGCVEKDERGNYIDVVNRSLKAIGGTQVTFGDGSWSSSRRYDNNAWDVYTNGYSNYLSFNASLWVRGVVLLEMNEVNC